MSRFIFGGAERDTAMVMVDVAANRPATATVDAGTIFVATDTGVVSVNGATGWVPIPGVTSQLSVSPGASGEVGDVVNVTATLLDVNSQPVVGALVALVSTDNTAGVVYGAATVGTLLYAASAVGTLILGITGAGGVLSVPATYLAGALVQTWRAQASNAANSGQFTATATWA